LMACEVAYQWNEARPLRYYSWKRSEIKERADAE
jgi:hypothetical protein